METEFFTWTTQIVELITANEFSSTVLTIYSMEEDLEEKEIRIALRFADKDVKYFNREEIGYLLWKVESLRDKVVQLKELLDAPLT